MSSFGSLASAIAQAENSQYPNNPGGILDSTGTPVNYGSMQSGYDALESQLEYDASGNSSVYTPNESLSDYFQTYTGGNQNEGNTVASILGVSPSSTLASVSDQNLGMGSNTDNGYSLPDMPFTSIGEQSPVNVSNSTNSLTTTNPNGTTSTTQVPQSAWSYILSKLGDLGNVEADIVGVLVGLIFIAGAVFTFSQVKDTVVTYGRKAMEAGVIAA